VEKRILLKMNELRNLFDSQNVRVKLWKLNIGEVIALEVETDQEILWPLLEGKILQMFDAPITLREKKCFTAPANPRRHLSVTPQSRRLTSETNSWMT
jgi:hypothetical protein